MFGSINTVKEVNPYLPSWCRVPVILIEYVFIAAATVAFMVNNRKVGSNVI